MPLGPWEARLLNLERLLNRVFDVLTGLAARLTRAEQAGFQAWGAMPFGAGTPATPQLAILTTTLASGSPGSPATASATLYTEAGGFWAAGTAINLSSTWPLTTALAAGKQVWVILINGTYYVTQGEC